MLAVALTTNIFRWNFLSREGHTGGQISEHKWKICAFYVESSDGINLFFHHEILQCASGRSDHLGTTFIHLMPKDTSVISTQWTATLCKCQITLERTIFLALTVVEWFLESCHHLHSRVGLSEGHAQHQVSWRYSFVGPWMYGDSYKSDVVTNTQRYWHFRMKHCPCILQCDQYIFGSFDGDN